MSWWALVASLGPLLVFWLGVWVGTVRERAERRRRVYQRDFLTRQKELDDERRYGDGEGALSAELERGVEWLRAKVQAEDQEAAP